MVLKLAGLLKQVAYFLSRSGAASRGWGNECSDFVPRGDGKSRSMTATSPFSAEAPHFETPSYRSISSCRYYIDMK